MSPAAEPPADDGLPNPQRLLAFVALATAIGMAVLDGAIVNVALPTIGREFAVTPANSVWIVNAFQLAVTVSLLPLAALGDTLGYRRVYWPGLALFTAASLACALAPNFGALTLARAVQGLGAAGIMSVNIALVRFIYPSSQLGQGVGNMAVVVAVCSAGSPTVAAAILSVASWRWLFLVNVPIGVVALMMARRIPARHAALGPGSRSVERDPQCADLRPSDYRGEWDRRDRETSRSRSPRSPRGRRSASPSSNGNWGRRRRSCPWTCCGKPIFALSLATSIASFGAASLALVALPFFFEDTLHRSETATGLLMTPWPLATALIAPVAGRLADRFRPGLLGSAGLAVMSAGLVLLALHGHDAGTFSLVWRLAVCGLGFGFFQSPNNRLIIGSAPPERSGGAAGLQSSGRLIGQSFGTALMAVAFGPGAGACDGDRVLDRRGADFLRRLRERPAQGGRVEQAAPGRAQSGRGVMRNLHGF